MSFENTRWAEAEIAKHEAAIADLRAYIRVEQAKSGRPISTVLGPINTTVLNELPLNTSVLVNGEHPLSPTGRGAKKLTILNLLSRRPGGTKTTDIVSALVSMGFGETTVSNTSPQLSTYGSDGLVTLDDGLWKITTKGREYLDQKI